MKAVLLVTLLSMGSVSAEGCVSCLGALGKTAELMSTIAEVDDTERQRALERKVVLLEEEQAVRAELSRVRQRADRLERAREARAVLAAAPEVATVATANAAVLAVLELEPRAGLSPESAGALTTLVHLELLATGRVALVPLERTREALRAASAEGAGACYDDRCQLELGKALAARALVRPVLQPDGHGCVLALEVYELTRETLEWARTERSGCDADALAGTARRLAQALVAPTEDATRVLAPRAETLSPATAPPMTTPRAPLVPR